MIELLFTTLLAVASAAQSTSAAPAPDEILVVDEDDRTKVWQIVNEQPIRREDVEGTPQHACVSLGFIVESDGTTSTHQVLRSKPKGALDAGALKAIKEWRFKPGPKNPNRYPMYTTAIFNAGFANKAQQSTRIGCLVEIVVPGKKKRRPEDR